MGPAPPLRRGRTLALAAALALAAPAALAACGGDDEEAEPPERATPPAEERPEPEARSRMLVRSEGGPEVETVARGLDIPWEIAFLPDGRALVTERPGRVRLLSRSGRLRPEPAARVEVSAVGEGGLLGLAIDPSFEDNSYVYLYRTTASDNRVDRYRLRGERLEHEATIVRGIAAAAIHDGGRIHFGPDDRLYIATGDAGQPTLSQDPDSLNGKLLRMDAGDYRSGGGRPVIFSLGHRNPQGFDWQPGTGRLISDEHGPEGNDEVNWARRGRNYGWPEVEGEGHGRYTAPLVVYPEAIAPSGATFVHLPGSRWTGDYLIGCLRGEQVRRVGLDGTRVTANEALFEGELGRVRTVREGPDGALYALTSNRDGRGTPREGDDRVVRIVPPAS